MRQENAFKIRLIKLLEILRQHSDEDNYMSTTEIIERLAAIGIICDRRTLYKDVELLNESGYEVLCEKAPGKPNGYCVADRSFNVSELRILMDAVQASSFITPKKTEELVDKIANLGGSHRAELLQSNIVKFNTTKSILNCVPRATRLLTIPNGKNCVGAVYHIIVPNEHTGTEVVVVYQRYFICLFKDIVISCNFTWRPFHCLIWTGNSTF